MTRHVDHALSETAIGTKDVHLFHEEHLANEISWTWTRRSGQRVSLCYRVFEGAMTFRIHRPNNGTRVQKEWPLAIAFESTEAAKAYAWATIRRDTMPHGEAAHAGRLGRIG